MLRNLLLLGQDEHMSFGKAFTGYETADTGVTAHFADGSCENGTLLVGVEGIVSQVKKQLLPHYKYVDTGSCVIYSKQRLPLISRLAFRLRHWNECP
jgi:hypothetical protein